MNSSPPKWDERRAQSFIGRRVLIGVTYASPEGQRLEQMFGTVTCADARKGFEISLEGTRSGNVYWLPPHVEAFHPARPGEYRLKSTGEIVINPDFTTSWTIEKPLN